jgi:guanine deaminase
MAASVPIQKTIYVGPFVHCKSLAELDICEKGAIGVDEKGVIVFVERDVEGVHGVEKVREKYDEWKDASVVRIEGEGFFFPGFIGMLLLASSPSPPQSLSTTYHSP